MSGAAVSAKQQSDLNPAYPGLSVDLLMDIYGVHKAMHFGRFQRSDYSINNFITDVKSADKNAFGEAICAPFVDKKHPRFVLSFYPLYLVKDDVFKVMACHFAVSLVVKRMILDSQHVDGLYFRSVVVPAAITSRYDPYDEAQPILSDLEQYLRAMSPTTPQIRRQLQSNPSNVSKMASIIYDAITAVKRMRSDITKNILIVFDRRKAQQNHEEYVCVLHCDDLSKLNQIDQNYWISFEFRVPDDNDDGAKNDAVDVQDGGIGDDVVSSNQKFVRCWMIFGMAQKLRFYPEYAVWIIPYLFVRPTTAAYQVVDALYGNDYKHGWCVSLDDAVFNKYYHILTQHKHISNNYNRREVALHTNYDIISVGFGLRDQLIRSWRSRRANVRQYIEEERYDSDTVLQDLVTENGNIDVLRLMDDSNIFAVIMNNGHDSTIMKSQVAENENNEQTERVASQRADCFADDLWRIQFILNGSRRIGCRKNHVLDLKNCLFVKPLIRNLVRFQKDEREVEASNVYDFNLDVIIQSFDHLVNVHNFLSDDEAKTKIRKYIEEYVQCQDGDDCEILEKYGNQIRERNRNSEREKQKETSDDEVGALIELVGDAIHAAHCYVLHGGNKLFRMAANKNGKFQSQFTTPSAIEPVKKSSDEQDAEDEQKSVEKSEKQPLGINFGRNVLGWIPHGEESEFSNLREEILGNPASTIDEALWEANVGRCAAKIEGTDYTLNEMLCLKLYSDTNELQAALRRAHWDTASDEERYSFYQWATGMYRTHLFHAKPIPSGNRSSPIKLYHGLNQMFTMSQTQIYFGPFSTTKVQTVATQFCKVDGNKGLIWVIQSSYVNPLRFCVGIDMESISGLKNEREVLLYNQYLPIQKTDLFDEDQKVLINHMLFSLQRVSTPILNEKTFYNKLGVEFNREWIPHIMRHNLLFEKSKCGNMTIIQRLYQELRIEFFGFANGVQNCFAVDQNNILTMWQSQNFVHFDGVFAVAMGEDVDEEPRQHQFDDISTFAIPCGEAIDCETNSLKLILYCKPTDDSFDYAPIHSTVLPRYEFVETTPVVITESVKVLPFDEQRGQNGSLLIRCASDFTIGPHAVFDANGVMNNSGGGIIRIIARGTVTNKGTICCNGLNEGQCGAIYIVADSFVNEGKVECTPNGRISLFCSEYDVYNGVVEGECEILPPQPIEREDDAEKDMYSLRVSDLCAIEYLMHSLQTKSDEIANADAFYSEIGIRCVEQWCPVINVHDLLKAPTQFSSRTVLQRLANELKIEFFGSIRTWKDIVHAVAQELYPEIGGTLEQTVDALVTSTEETLSLTDVSQGALDKVIEMIKIKRNILYKEVVYIGELLKRDSTRQEYRDIANYYGHEYESPLSSKWEGLNLKMLVEVYGAHKAMKYGMFQRAAYTKTDYMADIEKAEMKILKENCVSQIMQQIDVDSTVSFHPEYVIEDDMFETVNCILALSVMMNRLRSDKRIRNGFQVKCVVVPKAVTSIYEQSRNFHRDITDISQFLERSGMAHLYDVQQLSFRTDQITASGQAMAELLYQRLAAMDSPVQSSMARCGIVFDRTLSHDDGTVMTHIFGCNDWSTLEQLDRTYSLGMEMEMGYTPIWSRTSRDWELVPVIRCYLTFGMAQKVRFFPEQLVWILPCLFRRSSTMTPYAFLKKMYSAEYKWGWSVSLKDEQFERFYHILTGSVHCTANYNLVEVTDFEDNEELKLGEGLRDYLEKSYITLMLKLSALLTANGYDSDALVEDVLEVGPMRDSNILREFNVNDQEFDLLQSEVMRFKQIDEDSIDEEQTDGDKSVMIKAEDEEGPPTVDFGFSVLQWLSFGEEPECESLRSELLRHPQTPFTSDSTMQNSLDKFIQICATIHHENPQFSLPEILVSKVLTDCTNFGVHFRRAHFRTASLKQRKLMYNMAMTLYRVHLRHAAPISPVNDNDSTSKPRPLYLGWIKLFSTMNNEDDPYIGALSATISRSVARTFCKDSGSIYTFQSSYINPFLFCVGVPVTFLSGWKNENEVVLHHQFLPLSSTTIFENNPQALVDHLLWTLLRKPIPIMRPAMFYKQSGIKWQDSWIPMIMTHKLLFRPTKCGQMTVLERLSDELRIGFFQLLVEIRSAIVISEDKIILSAVQAQQERDSVIGDYVFTATLGEEVSVRNEPMKFENIQQFAIPLNKVINSEANSLTLHLFCKAANDSFDFASIYSTVLPRYQFAERTAVTITQSVDIPIPDEQHCRNGNLVIRCSSDFTIGPDVVFNGSGVKDESKGGAIRIISSGTLINKGTLRCNGVNEGREGDIYIVADSLVNEGKIECGPNGRIYLFCTNFICHDEIEPGPMVNIPGMEEWESEDVTRDQWTLIDYLMQSLLNKEELIDDAKDFYTEIGVECKEEWCPLMDEHGLLDAVSRFDGRTVARRLAEELNIEYFMD